MYPKILFVQAPTTVLICVSKSEWRCWLYTCMLATCFLMLILPLEKNVHFYWVCIMNIFLAYLLTIFTDERKSVFWCSLYFFLIWLWAFHGHIWELLEYLSTPGRVWKERKKKHQERRGAPEVYRDIGSASPWASHEDVAPDPPRSSGGIYNSYLREYGKGRIAS